MDHFTPKQVARAIGVSDASLKRWCDGGKIAFVRTVGGHRRIQFSAVFEFLRTTGRPIVRPEILRLPATCGSGKTVAKRAVQQTFEALASGDEQLLERLMIDLQLAGRTLSEIIDDVIAPALCLIGEHWQQNKLEIYCERRACDILCRTLAAFMRRLPPPSPTAPRAIGCAAPTDPYLLPTMLVEATLREVGWRAESLGSGLPVSTIRVAIERTQPRLFWMSASWVANLDRFFGEAQAIFDCAVRNGASMVVGGRLLTNPVRARLRYAAFCDTFEHLVNFAASLAPSARQRKENQASKAIESADDAKPVEGPDRTGWPVAPPDKAAQAD